MNLSRGTHYSQPQSCPEAPYKPRLQAAAQPCGLCFKTDDYLRVIDAVRSERMVGLMPQRGTVLGGVVVGLWHVYHCLVVQGYCVSIEGPVSAVYLVCKAKIQCVWGGVNLASSLKANVFKYKQLKLFLCIRVGIFGGDFFLK